MAASLVCTLHSARGRQRHHTACRRPSPCPPLPLIHGAARRAFCRARLLQLAAAAPRFVCAGSFEPPRLSAQPAVVSCCVSPRFPVSAKLPSRFRVFPPAVTHLPIFIASPVLASMRPPSRHITLPRFHRCPQLHANSCLASLLPALSNASHEPKHPPSKRLPRCAHAPAGRLMRVCCKLACSSTLVTAAAGQAVGLAEPMWQRAQTARGQRHRGKQSKAGHGTSRW